MDITVTVDPGSWSVKLVATDYTGTVSWLRRYAGNDEEVGTGTPLWDQSPEFGVPYEYVATDDVESQVSAPTTVTADAPVITVLGQLYAVAVTVVAYQPTEYQSASVWHPVLNRSDPFITVHPMLYPRGTLRLHAPGYGDLVDLVALLPSGRPLLLRTTCPERVPTFTFMVERVDVSYAGDGAQSGPAWVDIQFQQITEQPGIAPPVPDRTYQSLLDEGHTDYAELNGAYSDYLQLLEGVS